MKRKSRFNDLLIDGLESEHMNYHLKKLVNLGLVEKCDNCYKLTDKGKDYSNLMDDDMKLVEKQPKTSVILRVIRKDPKTGYIQLLLNRRLREPYYGKVGKLTGKVHFGETIEDAAARELFEETGLKAEKITIEEIYRKMRHREDGTFAQDVVFFMVFIDKFSGTFIGKTQYQENFWLSEEEYKERDDIDLFDDFVWHTQEKPRKITFHEYVNLVEDAF